MFSSYELFLQPGSTAEEVRHQLTSHLNKWEVDMGAIHGVPTASDDKVEFAIYRKKWRRTNWDGHCREGQFSKKPKLT